MIELNPSISEGTSESIDALGPKDAAVIICQDPKEPNKVSFKLVLPSGLAEDEPVPAPFMVAAAIGTLAQTDYNLFAKIMEGFYNGLENTKPSIDPCDGPIKQS